MMTILICAHKEYESTEVYSSVSANLIEFICPPSDQPIGLGRGYFFDSVDKIVRRYA